MTPAPICRAALLAPFVLLAACRVESDPVAVKVQPMSFANSEWSEPVNLGPVVNSSAGDQNAALSKDGLSLYFSSTRAGGAGGLDIWLSQRDCTDADDPACAWHTPVNLGSGINGPGADFAPNLSDRKSVV